jgi:fatty acid desaturase
MPQGEYILLESDEQHTVPHPRGPRKRHARVEAPDRIRRRVLRLEIIDYFYLAVRVQRAQSVMAEYVLDLRFVDPSVRMSRHIATRWLVATLVLAALAVAIGLRVQGSAAPGNWLVACLIASTLAVGAGFVCAYRTTETLAVFSIHGRARLLEYSRNCQ